MQSEQFKEMPFEKQKNIFSDGIKNRRTLEATTPTPDAATQVRNGWIMQNFAFLCITDTWNNRHGFGG